MRMTLGALALFMGLLWGTFANAQSVSWVQIEARPTLQQAQERARAYANAFANVNGFQLRSGWYAIALGPFTPEAAALQLSALRGERLIPNDSFLADGNQFRQQFWPVGGTRLAPVTPAQPTILAPSVQIEPADETPAQARRSERELDRSAREQLQEALQWEGFYASTIDGAFGPGTRRAMADYQRAEGFETTGILTAKQRQGLLNAYEGALSALGMQTIDEVEAGIRVALPQGMVAFDHYEAPFAHFNSVDDSGVRALLISQPGDQDTLFGLYDVMQTLDIVPLDGARERKKNSFVLTGQNAEIQSYTYAALIKGTVKGFTLIWRPEDEKLMTRAVQMMRDSFVSLGPGTLNAAYGATTAAQSIDLLAGLNIRRPGHSQSGFYVDQQGHVLTTADTLAHCARITIGDELEASVSTQSGDLNLAIVRANAAQAPRAHAAFQTRPPRLKSEVAVAGFSYGDVLDTPIMTFGILADLKGLSGEDGLQRLALATLPGDVGGPVFDQSGAVMGMLLPRTDGARQLPEDVNFAAKVPNIAEFLSSNGITVAAADATDAIAPEDLTALAADMTVLVNCWN